MLVERAALCEQQRRSRELLHALWRRRGHYVFKHCGSSWRLREYSWLTWGRSAYWLAMWPRGSTRNAWTTKIASHCYQLTCVAQNTCEHRTRDARGRNVLSRCLCTFPAAACRRCCRRATGSRLSRLHCLRQASQRTRTSSEDFYVFILPLKRRADQRFATLCL